MGRVEKKVRELNSAQVQPDVFAQLTKFTQADIQRDLDAAEQIQKTCTNYCFVHAQSGQLKFIPLVISFLHNANRIDGWLIIAAQHVLPKLHPIYCQILRTADPSRAARGTRTNLTPLVKQNRTALCALGSILEHVINFCDVDSEHVAKHLKTFLLSSSAVLLASDIQSSKEVLCINPCMYATDDIVRKASWALSNILLAFPRLIPAAEPVIMKRIDSLIKLLREPYELTVQRSAIVTLKSLYTHGSKNVSQSEESTRDVIESKIKSAFPACPKGYTAFQQMELSDSMFKDVDVVLGHFLNMRDLNERGVTTDRCSVQIKCLEDRTRRRAAFRNASIDWNLNGMMARYEDDSTVNWPFFAVQKFEWRRKNTDLWMRHRGWEGRKATDVVVRFKNEALNDIIKSNIEHRVRSVMFSIESDLDYESGGDAPNSEDSDIVETQHVKTMDKKWSSVPRERSDSDDREPPGEGGDDGDTLLHDAKVVQHDEIGEGTKINRDAGNVLPEITTGAEQARECEEVKGNNQIEGEYSDVDWTETVACNPALFKEDIASRDFSRTNDLVGANSAGGGYILTKTGDVSGAVADASGEASDSNFSDGNEREGFVKDADEIGKATENYKRKSKVQFAANAEEIEVIVISGDEGESVEPINLGYFENDDKGKDIKEEDEIENMELGENSFVPRRRLRTGPRTRPDESRKQIKSGILTGTRKRGTRRRGQGCDHIGHGVVPAEFSSNDEPNEYGDCSDESRESEDLSDDDYIPENSERVTDEEFINPGLDKVKTRRQEKEQVGRSSVRNGKETAERGDARQTRTTDGLGFVQSASDRSDEKLQNGIAGTVVEAAQEQDGDEASDDIVEGSDLDSNLLEDNHGFENGLDKFNFVDHGKPVYRFENGERRTDPAMDTKDDDGVYELVENIPNEGPHRISGEVSEFLGDNADNAFVAEEVKDLDDVVRVDENRNDGHELSNKKFLGKNGNVTPGMISYSEMRDQFGSLVENLNEVLRENWKERKRIFGQKIQRAKVQRDRKHARARTNSHRELQRLYNDMLKGQEVAYRKHINSIDAAEKCLNELSSQLKCHETNVERLGSTQKENKKTLEMQLQRLQVDTQKRLGQLTRRSRGVHESADKRCSALSAQLRLLSAKETF